MSELELDPLRRGDAFAETVIRMCREACKSKRIRVLAPSWLAIFALEQADLEPGSLRDVIDAAVTLAHEDDSEHVERRHLFPIPHDWPTMKQATDEFQEHYLRAALEREQWDIATAARVLGFSRPHIYIMLRRFGIPRQRKTTKR